MTAKLYWVADKTTPVKTPKVFRLYKPKAKQVSLQLKEARLW